LQKRLKKQPPPKVQQNSENGQKTVCSFICLNLLPSQPKLKNLVFKLKMLSRKEFSLKLRIVSFGEALFLDAEEVAHPLRALFLTKQEKYLFRLEIPQMDQAEFLPKEEIFLPEKEVPHYYYTIFLKA
jgi:hypothetical protein